MERDWCDVRVFGLGVFVTPSFCGSEGCGGRRCVSCHGGELRGSQVMGIERQLSRFQLACHWSSKRLTSTKSQAEGLNRSHLVTLLPGAENRSSHRLISHNNTGFHLGPLSAITVSLLVFWRFSQVPDQWSVALPYRPSGRRLFRGMTLRPAIAGQPMSQQPMFRDIATRQFRSICMGQK